MVVNIHKLRDIFNKKDFIHELDCAGDDDDVYWHFPYSYTALSSTL